MSRGERDKWDARYRTGSHRFAPSPFLVGLDDLLPRAGRALDIAGGDGRHAVWLAQRGLSVTMIDISEVALELAAQTAAEAGVAVDRILADLDDTPLPPGPWDSILIFNYLQRPMYQHAADALGPGGLLISCQPTHSSFEGTGRSAPSYVLADGELPGLVPPQLEVLSSSEGWLDEGRYQARLVARKEG